MSLMIQSFPPLYRNDARLLILGSMPGVASLQATQYYAHPHNLFWRFAGEAIGFDPALPYASRVAALLDGGIALWDVLASCRRPGSLDAHIDSASVLPNDIAGLLQSCPQIARICFNGAAAENLFRKHVLLSDFCPELQRLPSTSPANAGIPLNQKRASWLAALTRQSRVEC